MSDDEFQLVSKAQKGDKEAFGELASRYYDMVFAVILGVLNNREAALDATQDAFLKAYRNLQSFQGQSKFKTWLYRIAMNTAIDQTRRKRPTESLDVTDVSDDDDRPARVVTDPSRSAREKLFEQEDASLVQKALAELSPEHRAILVLREWEDYSYEDIAKMLEIELGTVMSRLYYARKKLAEVLRIQFKEGQS